MTENQTAPASAPVATATTSDLNLVPPTPVPQVAPERAAGLVPVSDDVKSKLATKVDAFIDELVAQDA
ncbi:MAG: toxic anion resistance protein, partial [Sphingomonadales bacterium]